MENARLTPLTIVVATTLTLNKDPAGFFKTE